MLFIVEQAAGAGISNETPQRQTNGAKPPTVSVRVAIEMTRIVREPMLSLDGQTVAVVIAHAGIHRATSRQSNVDWFRYWLKDEIGLDPAKQNQYIQWKGLPK